MSTSFTTSLLLLLLLLLAIANVISCNQLQDFEVLQKAQAGILDAKNWARAFSKPDRLDSIRNLNFDMALEDCVKLYEDTEPRLTWLVSGESHSPEDAVTWLSGTLASHRTCLDGLEEKGMLFEPQVAQNLTLLLGEALALYGPKANLGLNSNGWQKRPNYDQNLGLLGTWNAAISKADLVVAKDGSGNYKTVNEAMVALAGMGRSRLERVIIYVKSGIYNEKVEILRNKRNVMFVGDGMDKTIITNNLNVVDGTTTLRSATFGVDGDGFWARDLTFENTAGPQKHQAVALRVSSDLAVFYRCSIKGYQDTLLAHSLRQFYRDCHIYGTIDFIFGDASVVFQNCDIHVRRPMAHQDNIITAQGRENPNENTGISIVNSRVSPEPELQPVKAQFKTFLGRPWRQYSRTVFLKTDLDGLIHPTGWTEWNGNFALSTLYYGEYMNTGIGASTAGRVRWPGFHVISDSREADPFTVRNFIRGELWILATGVPFWLDI